MREYFFFRRYCSRKKEKFAKLSFFWYDEKENVQNSIQNKIFVEIEKTLRGFIMERIEKKELKKLIRENVKTLYRKTLENASPEELYQAAVFAVRDVITDKWMKTHDEYYERDAKVVYYLSMEFLMGRFFGNALINLEMFDEVKEVFAELGIDYNMVEEAEPDPGLGNGGLEQVAGGDVERDELHIGEFGSGLNDGAAEGIAGHDDDVEAFVNGLFDHGDTVGGVIAGGPEVAELDAVVLGKRLAGLIGGLVEGLVGDVTVVGDHGDLVLDLSLGIVGRIGRVGGGVLLTAGYERKNHSQGEKKSKELLHGANLPYNFFEIMPWA